MCRIRVRNCGISQAAQLRSPLLTAIGLVDGNPAFWTPHRIDVPEPIAKKLSQLCKIWWKSVHGGLLSK